MMKVKRDKKAKQTSFFLCNGFAPMFFQGEKKMKKKKSNNNNNDEYVRQWIQNRKMYSFTQ